MAEHSSIEWTDATWNPITGCSVVSPGCTNCYAMKLAGGRLKHHPSRAGLTVASKAGPVWNGQVRLNEAWLDQPLRWRRPRMIFVCAHGDLFHEDVPDEWIDRVFDVMDRARHHIFQVLTKRAGRMRDYMRHRYALPDYINVFYPDENGNPTPGWQPPRNVWLGVSVEDQQRAEERIPLLLQTPSFVRFLSAEPLLGSVNIIDAIWGGNDEPTSHLSATIDWVIAGGESGDGARPMQADWARLLRDQCAAADVPFFFKQWGNHLPAGQLMADGRLWSPVGGPTLHAVKAITGRLLDGVEHSGMPRVMP